MSGRLLADAVADFEKANAMYEKSRFPEAADAYEQMLRAGEISPAIYFNLGSAYFKSGQMGRAILNYRLARRLAPRDPDIRANLQFARNRVNATSASDPWWARAIQKLTLNEWTLLTTLAFWVWFVLLALGQWRPALKAPVRGPRMATGAALVVLGGCLALAWNTQARAPWAVVTAREAVIRNGPLDESPSYYTAHDGTELEVLDTKDDWLQVTDASRRTGWLRRQQVTSGSVPGP